MVTKDHRSRGPIPRPLTLKDATEEFRPYTFSLTGKMIYRIEEEMHRRRDLNRSETVRALIEKGLASK